LYLWSVSDQKNRNDTHYGEERHKIRRKVSKDGGTWDEPKGHDLDLNPSDREIAHAGEGNECRTQYLRASREGVLIRATGKRVREGGRAHSSIGGGKKIAKEYLRCPGDIRVLKV